MNVIKGLYPFWDDLMTDTRFTDAALSVNRPTRVGNVFEPMRPGKATTRIFSRSSVKTASGGCIISVGIIPVHTVSISVMRKVRTVLIG